jgi:hypothetical protein
MKGIITTIAIVGTIAAGSALAAVDMGTDGLSADIQTALTDLSRGHINMAVEQTERAETGMLNRHSLGDSSVDGALSHIKKADDDLKVKDRDGAKSELQEAQSALNGQ